MVGEIFIHVHNPGFVLKREEGGKERKKRRWWVEDYVDQYVVLCEPRRSHNRYDVGCMSSIASSNNT